MHFELAEEHRMLAELVQRFVADHLMPLETAARDAVKREALRRAGVGYVEVASGDTPQEVRAKIRKLIDQSGTVSA